MPLIWLWQRYQGQQLPPQDWRRVRSAILGFRYWIDEPGNDTMWFWSENHCLCFHVAQYLAGQNFLMIPSRAAVAVGWRKRRLLTNA